MVNCRHDVWKSIELVDFPRIKRSDTRFDRMLAFSAILWNTVPRMGKRIHKKLVKVTINRWPRAINHLMRFLAIQLLTKKPKFTIYLKRIRKEKSDRCLKVIYHTKLFDWRWWFKKWEVWKRATAFLELSLKIWKMKTPRRLGALKNGSKREWSPVTKEMALKKDVFNYKKFTSNAWHHLDLPFIPFHC